MKIWIRNKWRHLKFLWDWNFGHKTILKNCQFKYIYSDAIRYGCGCDALIDGCHFAECDCAVRVFNEPLTESDEDNRVMVARGAKIYGVTFDGIGVDLE